MRKVENIVDLELTVKDTGIGIAEEKLPYIFDAFVQTDKSITRKYGGTGLGLTITKKLVTLMKGSIKVKSELGKGTVFNLILSFGVSLAEKSIETASENPELFGLKVLLLDENQISTEYVSKILESFTFKVTRVITKEEGLRVVQSAGANFDLIVAVQGIVTTECEEFIHRVRKEKRFRDKKIILISSHSIDYLTKYKETGLINGFMMKPTNASILYETILDTFSNNHKQWYDQTSVIQRIRFINVKILVVEDNSFNQIVAKDILSSVGGTVDIADNGAVAVDMVMEGNYDIIIMDVQMPIMDGYEATRRIREFDTELNQNSKIVALTANALKGDREKCINAGMNDYLAKPITPEALINKVIEWLEPQKYALSTIEHLDPGNEIPVDMNTKENTFGKEAVELELENLRIALDGGKVSKIKNLVDQLSSITYIDKPLKTDLDSLMTMISEYDFDEAAKFITKVMKTLKEDAYE